MDGDTSLFRIEVSLCQYDMVYFSKEILNFALSLQNYTFDQIYATKYEYARLTLMKVT